MYGIKRNQKGRTMSLPLKPLMGTDGLGRNSRCGIQKRWPLKSDADNSLHWDYIQKINYSVQDFNGYVSGKSVLTCENIVFALTLVDWIHDAANKILGCYRDAIVRPFCYSHQDELDAMCKYFRAVRSFINAHPLSTDRHDDFGFDGDLICVDIRSECQLPNLFEVDLYKVTPSGLCQVDKLDGSDVVLCAYSKNEAGVFFHRIGLDLGDVWRVADLCIDRVYEFDRYLGGLKRGDLDLTPTRGNAIGFPQCELK